MKIIINTFSLLRLIYFFTSVVFAGSKTHKPNILVVSIDVVGCDDFRCLRVKDTAIKTSIIDGIFIKDMKRNNWISTIKIWLTSLAAFSTIRYPKRSGLNFYLKENNVFSENYEDNFRLQKLKLPIPEFIKSLGCRICIVTNVVWKIIQYQPNPKQLQYGGNKIYLALFGEPKLASGRRT
ncbi:hypothetical protein [Mariniflexile sp.]|uniref:hypothetical protein n=1 Tax=Mariniflexile sp. TaxID=1979402 RepID=UPI0035617B0D